MFVRNQATASHSKYYSCLSLNDHHIENNLKNKSCRAKRKEKSWKEETRSEGEQVAIKEKDEKRQRNWKPVHN